MDEAERNLTPEDFEELTHLLDGSLEEVTSEFSLHWLGGEFQLGNSVARNRALSRGVDEKHFIKMHGYYRVDVDDTVNDAYSRDNPGDRERQN